MTQRKQPSYDPNNVFAKILRKEISCDFILETEHSVVFKDTAPKAKIHVLLVPKGSYVDSFDFYKNASDAEILDLQKAFVKIVEDQYLQDEGFRSIANSGYYGGQEVPHFHIHILGKQKLNTPF